MRTLVVQLLGATQVTLQVFFLTLIFSLPLGFLVASWRMSRFAIVRGPVSFFIMIMRGTPLILQLLFVYFAPYYLFHFTTSRFFACILAFVLNYSAYFAEIYRGGFQSLDKGQHEASYALGLSKRTEFLNIKLPQVVRIVLPSVGNEVITLVKDTALAQTIGVAELFRSAQNASSRMFSVVPIFVAGLFYFVMNFVVSKVMDFLEHKFVID